MHLNRKRFPLGTSFAHNTTHECRSRIGEILKRPAFTYKHLLSSRFCTFHFIFSYFHKKSAKIANFVGLTMAKMHLCLTKSRFLKRRIVRLEPQKKKACALHKPSCVERMRIELTTS